MSKPILMPQVGQDLEEGKLIEWKVKVGDAVAKGDIVAVVESEKASFEVEAFEAGTVLDLLYKEGDTTKVLAPLMYVGDPNAKDAATPAKAPQAPAKAAPPPAVPAPAAPDAKTAVPPSPPVPRTTGAVEDDAAAVAESVLAPSAPAGTAAAGASPASGPAKVGRSSPLARRLAGDNKLDVASLIGTGPKGAVVKRDIETALRSRSTAPPAGAAPAATAASPSLTPSRAPAATPGGGKLHRAWLRKGEGHPVVMIHGFGGDHNAWRVLAAAAGLSRPILAVDLPGHGRSADPSGSLDAMAAAVAAALDEEGVTAADLVGHSLGAAVAVALADGARFTVRSLFLLAPAGLGPDINGAFLAGFARARSEATLAPWMSQLVADPAAIGPAFVRVTHETRSQPGIADAQQQVADAMFPDGTQIFSVRETLDRLAVPVRVVFGGADRIIPPRHVAGLPGTVAVHLFPGVGHMPQLEAREPVARLLIEHLRAAG